MLLGWKVYKACKDRFLFRYAFIGSASLEELFFFFVNLNEATLELCCARRAFYCGDRKHLKKSLMLIEFEMTFRTSSCAV